MFCDILLVTNCLKNVKIGFFSSLELGSVLCLNVSWKWSIKSNGLKICEKAARETWKLLLENTLKIPRNSGSLEAKYKETYDVSRLLLYVLYLWAC